MKVEFILSEDREILSWILELKVPFEVEQIAHNQIKYIFSRSINGKIEKLSLSRRKSK